MAHKMSRRERLLCAAANIERLRRSVHCAERLSVNASSALVRRL
jgi:hypothetical protein